MTIPSVAGQESYVEKGSLSDTVRMLGAMAHPCRLRLLILLAEGQVCDVTTLTHLCGKGQPYISQQLRILRDAGLVIGKQEAQHVCYRIANQRVNDVLQGAGLLERKMVTGR